MNVCLPTRPIDATKKAGPMIETVQGPRVLEIMDHRIISISEEGELIRCSPETPERGDQPPPRDQQRGGARWYCNDL